jgi:mxaK protein
MLAPNRPRRTVLSALYASRIAFIWLLIAAGIVVAIASAWRWYATWHANRAVAGLLAGQDIEVDPTTAPANVLFARAYYLLKRDRIDEAQILLDQANFRADPVTRVRMLYGFANYRIRASFEAIEQGKFDAATTLVGLAKDDYNAALRLNPAAWDVKYNLDVAARLVRDLPEGVPSEDSGQEAPQQIWTDLPGIPRGEP